MSSLVQAIGRRTLNSVNHLLDLFAFTNRIASVLLRPHRTGQRVVLEFTCEQIYFTAMQALPVVLFIALITGSTTVIQLTKQFGTLEGEGRNIVAEFIVILIIRELGPLFTALIVILRSAVAVTIEASYMSVLGELDAIEMQGIDPIHLICLPRLIGITVAIFCLFFIFDLVAILGGYVVAWTITDVAVGNFLKNICKAISGVDITVGIVKAIFFGFTITVTSLYRGFRVKKAITQIPPETSKAAIECLLYCVFINIIISVIFYL